MGGQRLHFIFKLMKCIYAVPTPYTVSFEGIAKGIVHDVAVSGSNCDTCTYCVYSV